MKASLVQQFADAACSSDPDLARPALLIAHIEYPGLDPAPYLDRLDAMGEAVRRRIGATLPPLLEDVPRPITVLGDYLFSEERFSGNRDRYEDPRNSFLNQVLDRRLGIPISLALVYLEVARRAGIAVEGVNFPGHFLLRAPLVPLAGASRDLIIDPFHSGAILSEHDCRQLLERHVGEDAAFDPSLLAPATKQQILARMLLNLKRIYVSMRSFPQARDVTGMLVAVDPSALTELRDRGLIAYHLRDFHGALRDLQTYLQLSTGEDDDGQEREQLWEHVKSLRRRVAELN